MFIEPGRADHSNHPTKEQQEWIAALNDAITQYAVVPMDAEAIQYLNATWRMRPLLVGV